MKWTRIRHICVDCWDRRSVFRLHGRVCGSRTLALSTVLPRTTQPHASALKSVHSETAKREPTPERRRGVHAAREGRANEDAKRPRQEVTAGALTRLSGARAVWASRCSAS